MSNSILRYKKIDCDTKFKTIDSRSTSDFSIELPETVSFDRNNCVFYLSDTSIPHSWCSIETDINDKIYFHLAQSGFVQSYIITLSPGNYTSPDIKNEIQTKLKNATDREGNTDLFICSYNSMKNTIEIKTNTANLFYSILTPDDLKTKFDGRFTLSYDITNPHDCNEMLSNLEGSNIFYNSANPFTSGYINLQPFRNIYIHSSALGNMKNVGCRGENTVIKKVPVNADYGMMIIDEVSVYNDYDSCSGRTLKKIDFQLRTSRGDLIPLHGCNWSFSIVFSRQNESS